MIRRKKDSKYEQVDTGLKIKINKKRTNHIIKTMNLKKKNKK